MGQTNEKQSVIFRTRRFVKNLLIEDLEKGIEVVIDALWIREKWRKWP